MFVKYKILILITRNPEKYCTVWNIKLKIMVFIEKKKQNKYCNGMECKKKHKASLKNKHILVFLWKGSGLVY